MFISNEYNEALAIIVTNHRRLMKVFFTEYRAIAQTYRYSQMTVDGWVTNNSKTIYHDWINCGIIVPNHNESVDHGKFTVQCTGEKIDLTLKVWSNIDYMYHYCHMIYDFGNELNLKVEYLNKTMN